MRSIKGESAVTLGSSAYTDSIPNHLGTTGGSGQPEKRNSDAEPASPAPADQTTRCIMSMMVMPGEWTWFEIVDMPSLGLAGCAGDSHESRLC
jgi:hypothetical protein